MNELIESAFLSLPFGTSIDFERLASRFPVKLEALLSIYSQESQARVMKSNPIHKARIQDYCSRYLAGEDLISLCASVDFPPCMMMRRMLEAMDIVSKQSIGDVLKSPHSLTQSLSTRAEQPEALVSRLQQDIARCVLLDPCYSPLSDLAKQAAGREYEMRLNRHLEDLGVAFWDEEDLRSKGFFKTPDVLLQVPIAVRDSRQQWRCVSWIDSKATFGDSRTHSRQREEQYNTYINHYGPGLVIYWFGYAQGLEDDSNLTVCDYFPDKEDIFMMEGASVAET